MAAFARTPLLCLINRKGPAIKGSPIHLGNRHLSILIPGKSHEPKPPGTTSTTFRDNLGFGDFPNTAKAFFRSESFVSQLRPPINSFLAIPSNPPPLSHFRYPKGYHSEKRCLDHQKTFFTISPLSAWRGIRNKGP